MQVLCKLRGSVVPKALIWSVPCSVLLHGCKGFADFASTFGLAEVKRDW